MNIKILWIAFFLLFFLKDSFSQERINSTSSQIIEEFKNDYPIWRDTTQEYPTIVVEFSDFQAFYFLDKTHLKCFVTILIPRSKDIAATMMEDYMKKYKEIKENTWLIPKRKGDLILEFKNFADKGYGYAITRKNK